MEVKPEGEMVVTDVVEYADEITVEVCGIQEEIIKRINTAEKHHLVQSPGCSTS